MVKCWKMLYQSRSEAGKRLGGAILFYTALPWPPAWPVTFERIAGWVPGVGLILAGLLNLLTMGLQALGMAAALQAGFLVLCWIGLTGGLHLDGVADSADGLAVTDRQKRLAVMKDSQTGAFGVMAIAAVMLMKTLALISYGQADALRTWAVVMALGWGRWGQLGAIAFYPYLRETGKGALHRNTIQLPQDFLGGTVMVLLGTGLSGYSLGLELPQLLVGMVGSGAIALGVGYWFTRQFGGHTGDTYGAVVEWSEALILAGLTLMV
ncbi:MAG: adenosylcobinamide-GDP ribazoletransferase [Synechocystis sp.]